MFNPVHSFRDIVLEISDLCHPRLSSMSLTPILGRTQRNLNDPVNLSKLQMNFEDTTQKYLHFFISLSVFQLFRNNLSFLPARSIA